MQWTVTWRSKIPPIREMLMYQESFLVSSKGYKINNNNNSNNNKQLIILQHLVYGRHGANCWETVIIQPILEMRKFWLLLGHEVRQWESWAPAQTLKTRSSDLNHPSVYAFLLSLNQPSLIPSQLVWIPLCGQPEHVHTFPPVIYVTKRISINTS